MKPPVSLASVTDEQLEGLARAQARPPKPLTTRGAVIAWRAILRAGPILGRLHATGRDLDALRAAVAAEIDSACEMPAAVTGRPKASSVSRCIT